MVDTFMFASVQGHVRQHLGVVRPRVVHPRYLIWVRILWYVMPLCGRRVSTKWLQKVRQYPGAVPVVVREMQCLEGVALFQLSREHLLEI